MAARKKYWLPMLAGLGFLVMPFLPGCASVPKEKPLQNSVQLTNADMAQWAYMAGQLADQRGDFAKAAGHYREALKHDPDSSTLRRHLVGDLIRLERFQEAQVEYRKYIEKKPEDRETRFMLAQLYEAVGDTKVAEALYRDATHMGKSTSGPFTKLGILLLRQAKDTEGVAKLTEALSIDPLDREARRVLVGYYQSKNKNDAAVFILKQALEHSPDDIEWMTELAKIYEASGHKKLAVETYLKIEQTHPDALEAHRFLSIYYLKRNDWQGAITQLEKILRLQPDDLLARRNIGLALYKTGQFDAARKHLDVLIKNNVADALTRYLVGSIYRNKGFNYLAVDEYRLAIQLDWQLVEAYLGLSDALLGIGEAQEAVEIMQTASTHFPKILQVQLNYGLVLLTAGKPDESLKVLNAAKRLAPKNAVLFLNIGRAYFRCGKFKQAVVAWKQAIKLNPNLADAYNFLGYTHAERGLKLQQAVRWLRKALQLEPNNGYYLDSLGWAFYKQGDYKRALLNVLAAIGALTKAKLPVEPILYEHLGDIYFQLKKFKKAEKAWRQALRNEPKNMQLKEKIRKLRLKGRKT